MASTQFGLLADTLQKTRDLTRWYISLLKEADPFTRFQCGDLQLNSIAWLVAHLTWAEDFLVLQATGGKRAGEPWLDKHGLGSDGELYLPENDMKLLLGSMKTVHEAAIQHITQLDDALLLQPNSLNVAFGGGNSYKMSLQHAIRHEATHIGQLALICKIHGIKTI